MTLAGTKVGHFRVEAPIGKGGMGEVYLGFNEALQKRVALKALRAGRRLSARTRARFLREARILSHLDHPNICRIHDYVEGDETDFLVLELIEGRSLPKAIEQGLEFSIKLRIAEQIANALIEAHAAGVVHRDLKPGNVMLTRESQVKVLDFGLARPVEVTTGKAAALGDLAAAQASEEITLDDEYDDGQTPTVDQAEMSIMLETRVGSVVGTPAYMSPEQARGEPATWASDMYSFGLLLQMLFTEKSPYEENIPGFILLRKAVQAETLPVTGLHADLTHLIERLKSPAPSSRPTAVEATARLRRIRDKPKRRMRRLIAVAVFAVLVLASVKYALDLRYERGVARQRQDQAEALIVYHLGDLRDKVEPLGRLDILDGVGNRALEYFQSIDESLLSTDELSRYAMALTQIGEVRMDRGNLEGALEAFRESLSRAESLATRDPLNGAWQKGLGAAHFYVGIVQWERGDIEGALEHVQTYRKIAEGLVEREPDVDEWQLELAYSHTNTGSILEAKGDLRGAITEYEAALEIKQSLVREKPDDLERRHSMTVTHEDLADAFQSLGRLDAAEDHYRRSVEIKQALVGLEPDNVGWHQSLGVGLSRLGNLLSTKGDSDAALEQFKADLEISERLVERDPENMSWRRGAAISHVKYGVELKEHDPAAALAHLDTARKLLSEIIEKDPTHTRWQRDLTVVDVRIAEVLESLGKLERARRSVDTAREALEILRDAQPGDRETARRLGSVCLVQGRILEKLDREGEARAAWQRALKVVEPVARDSDETEFLNVWARILLRLDRLDDAGPVVRKLRSLGYSDDDLDELLRDKGVTT